MKSYGYIFWDKVDSLNPYKTAKELAEKIGMSYPLMKQERMNGTLPKPKWIKLIANELKVEDTDLLIEGDDSADTRKQISKLKERLRARDTDTSGHWLSPQVGRIYQKIACLNDEGLNEVEKFIDYQMYSNSKQPGKGKEDYEKKETSSL